MTKADLHGKVGELEAKLIPVDISAGEDQLRLLPGEPLHRPYDAVVMRRAIVAIGGVAMD